MPDIGVNPSIEDEGTAKEERRLLHEFDDLKRTASLRISTDRETAFKIQRAEEERILRAEEEAKAEKRRHGAAMAQKAEALKEIEEEKERIMKEEARKHPDDRRRLSEIEREAIANRAEKQAIKLERHRLAQINEEARLALEEEWEEEHNEQDLKRVNTKKVESWGPETIEPKMQKIIDSLKKSGEKFEVNPSPDPTPRTSEPPNLQTSKPPNLQPSKLLDSKSHCRIQTSAQMV